jgi:hypothetical protein
MTGSRPFVNHHGLCPSLAHPTFGPMQVRFPTARVRTRGWQLAVSCARDTIWEIEKVVETIEPLQIGRLRESTEACGCEGLVGHPDASTKYRADK